MRTEQNGRLCIWPHHPSTGAIATYRNKNVPPDLHITLCAAHVNAARARSLSCVCVRVYL